MAKLRKPTQYEQEQKNKELLRNEIMIRQACLTTAEKKVNDLISAIKSGDTSAKTRKALAEQTNIVVGIKKWLEENAYIPVRGDCVASFRVDDLSVSSATDTFVWVVAICRRISWATGLTYCPENPTYRLCLRMMPASSDMVVHGSGGCRVPPICE